ncbi:MAG: (2Fe-2S)-binding protein [Bdellovibrionales bacterium]
MKVKVGIHDRDFVTLSKEDGKWSYSAKGCLNFLKAILELSEKSYDFNSISWDQHSPHVRLLMKELQLKLADQWELPYEEVELCHCRAVITEAVVDSIQSGADTVERVGLLCTAGTSCGSCKPDTESLLEFILQKS